LPLFTELPRAAIRRAPCENAARATENASKACEVEYGGLNGGCSMAHDASEDARRLLQAMEELQDRKVGYVMPEDQTLLTHVGLAWDIPRSHNAIEQLLEWGTLEPDEEKNRRMARVVSPPEYGYFTITPRGRELLREWAGS
jgi:hypothetical protein